MGICNHPAGGIGSLSSSSSLLSKAATPTPCAWEWQAPLQLVEPFDCLSLALCAVMTPTEHSVSSTPTASAVNVLLDCFSNRLICRLRKLNCLLLAHG